MNDRIRDLAARLVERGVEHAFGVTGSGPSLTLITALDSSAVNYFPTAHEASAAIMAGAVSAVTARTAVSISIRGPGFANMLPGIVNNHYENRPALSISECLSADVPTWRAHKRLDHGALMNPIVKARLGLEDAERQLGFLLDYAASEAPGPVHLDLCNQGPVTHSRLTSPVPDEREPGASVGKLLNAIKDAQRPIVIAGSLAMRRCMSSELSTLQVPVFTTAAAKGLIDETKDYSAGVFTGDGKRLSPEASVLKEADLVIGIGMRVSELLSPKPFGVPTILLDVIPDRAAEAFDADLSLVDDQVFKEVFSAVGTHRWGRDQIGDARRVLRSTLLEAGWLAAPCFEILNQLPRKHMLVLDTGSFCTIGEHVWDASPVRQFLSSSNGRYMGTAIPTAIGAAIANRDTPVICVVGDGGMRMYPSELKLAVREHLPLCVILMTDGLFGSVACVPQAHPVSRRALEVDQPSWIDSVEGMGCVAVLAADERQFHETVHSWDYRQPLFIEVPFDAGRYAVMTRDLR